MDEKKFLEKLSLTKSRGFRWYFAGRESMIRAKAPLDMPDEHRLRTYCPITAVVRNEDHGAYFSTGHTREAIEKHGLKLSVNLEQEIIKAADSRGLSSLRTKMLRVLGLEKNSE